MTGGARSWEEARGDHKCQTWAIFSREIGPTWLYLGKRNSEVLSLDRTGGFGLPRSPEKRYYTPLHTKMIRSGSIRDPDKKLHGDLAAGSIPRNCGSK